MALIKRLGHLALIVEDMERSLHFYCDILGLTKAFELHKDDGSPWIVYVKICEGQFIELFYGGQQKPEIQRGQIGFDHLCLEVYDIHEAAAHLRSNGIALDVEPKLGKDTNYQCWVRDPDGNRVELMQLSPGSPQMNS